jgi:hypothetical protein
LHDFLANLLATHHTKCVTDLDKQNLVMVVFTTDSTA